MMIDLEIKIVKGKMLCIYLFNNSISQCIIIDLCLQFEVLLSKDILKRIESVFSNLTLKKVRPTLK